MVTNDTDTGVTLTKDPHTTVTQTVKETFDGPMGGWLTGPQTVRPDFVCKLWKVSRGVRLSVHLHLRSLRLFSDGRQKGHRH